MVRTVLFVVALAVLPWIAKKLSAPPWGIGVAALPLILFLVGLNWSDEDPEENMLGSASAPTRRWLLLLLGAGGVAFGVEPSLQPTVVVPAPWGFMDDEE